MTEIILEIKDFPKYFVSNLGKVYSDKFKVRREMKGYLNNRGYFHVGLSKNKKQHYKLISRLVAEAFLTNPDNKEQVDHINRERDDNRIKNLRWVTHTENQQNTSVRKNNKLGIKNIHYVKIDNLYRFKKRITELLEKQSYQELSDINCSHFKKINGL